MEEKILICEDTLEGIFSGIYEVYARHWNRDCVRIQVGEDENYRLFAEYIPIETNVGNAVRVMKTLRDRFGEEAYKDLCLALATDDAEKAQAVFRTIELGLLMYEERKRGKTIGGKQVRIMDCLADDNVRKVMELSRAANNEFLHLRGFLRFQELYNGVLYAEIAPRDNVLPLLAPHFAERFSQENFLIYDCKRNQMVVHPAGQEWYLMQNVEELKMQRNEKGEKRKYYSEKEQEYRELFQFFCNRISIRERENRALQCSLLPLRFQKYMTEFMPK